MDQSCLFCKIAHGEIATKYVYEDEHCVAFEDISPQAPTHVLIIPRRHIASLDKTGNEDKQLLGHLLFTAGEIARSSGFADNGYRLVINTNEDGGQTVFHLHIHLLGGRKFIFPPG